MDFFQRPLRCIPKDYGRANEETLTASKAHLDFLQKVVSPRSLNTTAVAGARVPELVVLAASLGSPARRCHESSGRVDVSDNTETLRRQALHALLHREQPA